VVGFGLSNDERRGTTSEFEPAFRIARRAGLLAAPHGGELCGPATVRTCLDELGAGRIGHGVRSVEDPDLLKRIVDAQIALEVCPASNVSLGVYRRPEDVPLRQLYEAGARIALGADDPLLFGSRLAEQYETARSVHGFTDSELADLARGSVLASTAPPDVQKTLLTEIDEWLGAPATIPA
jgi:adenosine deaminase